MPHSHHHPPRSKTPTTRPTPTPRPAIHRSTTAPPTPSRMADEDASATTSSMTALASKAGPEESLRSYRLLEVLRAGDPATIKSLLVSYSTEKPRPAGISEPCSIVEVGGTSTPLHLAVRCAKYPTVELVLQYCPQSLNAQDARGQTPLHLAASLNRTDCVAFFLNQPNVDDTVKDNAGKTCIDVAGGSEVAGLISVSRSHYNEIFLTLLATYVASPSPEGTSSRLSTHLTSSSPKISQAPPLPPLSPPLPASPTSPSHINVSAASGHVSNVAAEKLYHFIVKPRSRCIDFSAKDGVSGSTVLHEAARRKDLGIIKLVIAKGGDVLARDRKGKIPVDLARDERIKQVLRHAATSEGRALRAASDLGSAPVVGQPPSMRGYLSKWTNMARGYRSRWFVLDNGTLSYYRSQEEEGKASRGAISMSVARILPPGPDKLKFEISNKLGKSFPSFWLKGAHPVEVMRWVEVLRQNIEFARDTDKMVRVGSNSSTYAGSIAPTLDDRAAREQPNGSSDPSRQPSPAGSFGDRDGSIMGDDETFNGDAEGVPRADDFDLLANATKAQLELTVQLLASLVVPSREELAPPADLNSRPSSIHSSTGRQADVKEALRGSLASLGGMLNEYTDVVAQRERYFVRKYEREIDAKRLWEENMKEVAAQHAAIELELQKVGRDNTRRKRALQEVRATLATSPALSPTLSYADLDANLAQLPLDGDNILSPPLTGSPSSNLRLSVISTGSRGRAASGSLSPSRMRMRSATMHTLNPVELEHLVDSALIGEADDESDEDEEEFFEAIESGSLPISDEGLVVRAQPAEKFMLDVDLAPYEGYKALRQRLPIDNDNRPPVSLWAILKGSIGKDLTKISFPVFFNEPTSMLQRMSEDLEFSECLDSAASDEDATKRIAYVAAFAMSNYSSTIGRIAKPFNPMLGETFEYVDITKKYRYISEQVVHHPPISACIAQAPTWEYFGEVDAKSKFLGKSFEIRPTGIAHVNLRLPQEWAPNYPNSPRIPGLVVEHYSWTKVTTSVSNFLFGNPIIDHYGDMIVTNHRTGDTCTLTFKPRGWRGNGACEIKGKVVDASGKEHWDIAGKWNSQLVARRVGHGFGDLAPDASVPTTQAGEVAPEYIRLWKNSIKPPGMPFNLTPFAITLNDTNPELKAWLPPTDCRLRPDQHAFESGKFEKANDLKTDLEEHQRATRRAREKGELPPHKARWFTRKKDNDTGESYWEPAVASDGGLEYWDERKRVGELKKAGEEHVPWKGVDPIFADF